MNYNNKKLFIQRNNYLILDISYLYNFFLLIIVNLCIYIFNIRPNFGEIPVPDNSLKEKADVYLYLIDWEKIFLMYYF